MKNPRIEMARGGASEDPAAAGSGQDGASEGGDEAADEAG
jgi:hypothetical protein